MTIIFKGSVYTGQDLTSVMKMVEIRSFLQSGLHNETTVLLQPSAVCHRPLSQKVYVFQTIEDPGGI